MKFNINHYVRVKFTKYGKTLISTMDELAKPKIDVDGTTKIQLWKLMHDFGKFCFNGSLEIPFETIIDFDMSMEEPDPLTIATVGFLNKTKNKMHTLALIPLQVVTEKINSNSPLDAADKQWVIDQMNSITI